MKKINIQQPFIKLINKYICEIQTKFIHFIDIESIQQISNKQKMLFNSRPHLIFLLLAHLCLSHTYALSHQQQIENLQNKEFEQLNSQQQSLEDKINSLLEDMTAVEKNVSRTPDVSEKVLLLERAILSEREKVFNMQTALIPPFTFSKTACLQLTNQQKIDMLDKIKTTKEQLTNLQKQIVVAPKCDKITALQKDTQKQITLLESLEKTIYTQCQSKSVLTPTVFQTNIYADGWILGEQDIDDLIEEYYQRNIRYHNITNCPLDKPFFNGEQCIICKDPEPVFNILTRECTHCPQDQQPDSDIRQCAWKPHYTNFSSVENWAKQGAAMPVPSRTLLPCPPQKPYYNGKKCQPCLMPKYWSIKRNACVECPVGTIFDLNDQRCEKPETNELTILQGTRWVTNDCNLTRIIEERVRVLNLNKTAKNYKMCPPQKPFYDGIVCVTCPNEFNIDTRRCVSSPNKSISYDENVRCYVERQTGFETDPRTVNYTTKTALRDTPTPNCKAATPYYDGIACIDCLEPFPIFDVDTRRCTACDAMEVYNNSQHKCVPRRKLYISTNEKNLMATPKMSIDDYHAEISQKIKENPQAVVFLCKDSQYSDYSQCFTCAANEYFNVETKKCQLCDGTLNPTTKVCSQKAYIYTNLNQNSIKRIVAVPSTIQQQNATINNNLKLHVNSKLCPVNQPYFDGSACTNCTTQSFNMTSRKCVPMQCTDPLLPFYNKTLDRCTQCPKDQSYSETSKKCQPITYVTNTNAIYFYIEEGNYTKNNLDDKIFELHNDYVVITCDASHPYWNGTDCIDCSISRDANDTSQLKPYFNLRTLACQSCKNWDKDTKICKDGVTCTDPTPYLDPVTNSCIACKPGTTYNPTTARCQACASGQIFNPKTSRCETWVTNITGLANNYIEEGNGTKSNLNSQIQRIKSEQKNVFVCPGDTPFFSRTEGRCVRCSDPTPYWNILKEACVKCQNYNADTHQCEQALPRFKMNVEDFYGTIFSHH